MFASLQTSIEPKKIANNKSLYSFIMTVDNFILNFSDYPLM